MLFAEDPTPFEACVWDGSLDGMSVISAFVGQTVLLQAGVIIVMIEGNPFPLAPGWWVSKREGKFCTHSPAVALRWRPVSGGD